jgi:hypothetical protein
MDKFILVAVALLVSVGAWFFWYAVQSDEFSIRSVIAIAVLVADNYRPRRATTVAQSCVIERL